MKTVDAEMTHVCTYRNIAVMADKNAADLFWAECLESQRNHFKKARRIFYAAHKEVVEAVVKYVSDAGYEGDVLIGKKVMLLALPSKPITLILQNLEDDSQAYNKMVFHWSDDKQLNLVGIPSGDGPIELREGDSISKLN